jgi:hypothetical protein
MCVKSIDFVSVSTLLHLRFGLVFLFFTLCDKIAAFCTSYNGVNVCVGFSLYIQSGIRGIYDDFYSILCNYQIYLFIILSAYCNKDDHIAI